jgi:UDPglucose 6-dehydrogenase
MSYVQAVAAEIGPLLEHDTVVVNKSTVPVGSTRVVQQALGRPGVSVLSNPEFLREGSAVGDFLHPDRIVIGADDQAAAIRLVELFAGVRSPVVVTDPPTAETIKYASNAFLATKVSFVNAIANVCEAVGANVREVVLGMGYDRRIGSEFLRPGPGWGGSCFPKDSAALVRIAENAGYDFGLLKGVIEVNTQQQERVVNKVVEAAGGTLAGKRVAAWGLTFKAGTDDLRDSPAVAVIERLAAAGAEVTAYDPTRRDPLPAMTVVADPYDACEDASVLAVLTEWDQFRWLDLGLVRSRMASPRIVDTRGLIEPAAARRAGFVLSGVGMP